MSRLDYITIAIVAACILAIIFLVYKMTDLFNEQPVVDPIESEVDKVEQEDSTYNYNIDEDSPEEGEASTDTEPTSSADENADSDSNNSSTTSDYDEEDKTPPPTNTISSSQTPRPSSGRYMVIAGTFAQKASAKKQLQKLKKMGYSDATIEPFDRGKFDVVLAGRFDNMADAERLVKDLTAEDIKSYVKMKERSQ